ncbi:MAG TPA: IS3 family transposase, partial [Candidatus Paceibacterota bacterium]
MLGTLNRLVLSAVEGKRGSISRMSIKVYRFETLGELTAELYRSIYYYNNLRIHTSLGMAPKKFTEKFAQEKEIK